MAGQQRDAGRRSGLAFSAALGGVAGLTLAGRGGRRWAVTGGAFGAAGLAAVDAIARARQRPNEIPALWSRIAASAAIAAPAGWLAERAGARPVAVGTASGAVAGLLGLRPQKVALGPAVGPARRARRWPDAAPLARSCRSDHRADVPGAVGGALPGRAGEPARRARAGRGPAVRRAVGVAHPLRRDRVRARAGCARSAAATRPTLLTSASWPRSTTSPAPSSTRAGRPAGPRVLRAHDPVHPRHRPAVAALGAAGLPALPLVLARPLGQASVPMNQREAQRGVRSRIDTITSAAGHDGPPLDDPWLDPLVRRQRRAHLRRHLHDLPQRRPRVRQRRLSTAAGELHRHPGRRGSARVVAWC